MIDLYYMPGAASLPVHVLLEEVGASYRLVRVRRDGDRIEPPELARLNPHRRVPVLVEGDLVLYEAAACVMHVCDRHPDAGLAPAVGTPERALWYRWLVYLTNTVQATFMSYLYPDRYTTDADGAPAVKERARSMLAGMRDVLSSELAAGGPYALGERYTGVDPYLAMVTRWGRHLDPKWWEDDRLGAHYRLVRSRPAVERVYEQQGLDDGA